MPPTIEIPIAFEDVGSPIPAGMYKAEVSAASLKTVKNPESKLFGSTMISWEFTIIDPEYPDLQGRKIYYNSNLNDKVMKEDGSGLDMEVQKTAIYFLGEFYKALGLTPTGKQFTTEDAIHAKAIIKVTGNVYKGKPVSNIDQVLPWQD